jgi:predicted SprT family Zn-dependent metalloprotease
VDPYDARQLAWDLMRQHGLLAAGWTFKFDHARRRFGSCRPRSRAITLSRPLTLLNGDDQVRDTILHEIAHALTPGDGHGPQWKAKCREIGARPQRCYTDADVSSPPRKPAPYRIGCVPCGWWVDRRRLTPRTLVCRTCRTRLVYQERAGGALFRVSTTGRGRGATVVVQPLGGSKL